MRKLIATSPRFIFAMMSTSMYLQIIVFFGLSFSLAYWVHHWCLDAFAQWGWLPLAMQHGFALSCTFVGLTFAIGVLVVVLVRVLFLRVPAGRYRAGSLASIRWATYNFYILLFRYTLMNFIRATPLQPWFYRLLGATIGKGVQMNSKIIGDCNLLTIGDYSMVGGDATIVAHSYERGHLVIDPVHIGNRVDIGMNSVIMPGVHIEDRAVVAAGAVVKKGTHIPAGTIWAGVPAKQIRGPQDAQHRF